MRKRYTILILTIISGWSAQAQTRQNVANFSQFKQFFNPALTGNDGTRINNFYRDHWTTFEDAPRTLFVSGEVNLADISNSPGAGVQHAFGVSLMNDKFGAYRENRAELSYGAGIKLSETFKLKAGIATTYNSNKVNIDGLVLADNNDAAYNSLLSGSNNVNKFGVNIGVAITSQNFYAGYGITDIVQSNSKDNDSFDEIYVPQHALQAGYRRMISGPFGLVANAIYRYDKNLKGQAEGQLKGVFFNTFWVGGGYRNDVAYTFNAGFRYKQLKIGYTREMASNSTDGVYRGGNEITLAYNFTPILNKGTKLLTIW